jgi:ABC-type phosphate transport system substrate-binding protein
MKGNGGSNVKRLWKAAIAAVGVALVAGPVLAVSPAGATPPTGYGFDNTSHVIMGGGSDTTYAVQTDLGRVWNLSQKGGCQLVTAVGATLGQCVATGSPETNTLTNYQHDSVGQAPDVGSSAGVSALNAMGTVNYSGTLRPIPAAVDGGACDGGSTGNLPDFGRSSRGPRTTGGGAPGGNELTCDTFWGFAQDGIEVTVFNQRGPQVQAAGGSAITPNELYHIWNCDYDTWSDIASLGIAPGSANDAPIVAWGMNSNSGTYATMNDYLIANGGAPAGWAANNQACVKKKIAASNIYALENDIKEIVNSPDIASLSTAATSPNNPKNWIWWGSFGAFSAYPSLSKTTRAGTTVTAVAAKVNGVLPSTAGILANTYPIGRTLYHVTRVSDADCPTPAALCNFTGTPGPAISGGGTDLGVSGGTSGVSGAVREYTRFICRNSAAQQGLNPYTAVNLFSEVTGALNKSGFVTVPLALRSPGSRCRVLS